MLSRIQPPLLDGTSPAARFRNNHPAQVGREEIDVNDADLNRLRKRIEPARSALASHELYDQMRTLSDVRSFVEHHVFAVWDFMSLLKALQRAVTSVDRYWQPVGTARTRRLINTMVLEEESDVVDGVAMAHFELYLRAMREIGAETTAIDRFLSQVRAGGSLDRALAAATVPAGPADFVRSTFEAIDSGKAHVIAACFAFGREDSVPDMFRNIRGIVRSGMCGDSLLLTYIDRHLQLDEEEHGPMAVEMVYELCGDDPVRWREAEDAAEAALLARLRFWQFIGEHMSPAMPQPLRQDMRKLAIMEDQDA